MSTALYRKYRPDTFDNIIGQNQVTDVLKNQIKENKISHAYIFSGSRGTGKTSTAKVFAKAINCADYNNDKGPCNKCDSCINNYVDVVEIDAASNNSVDDVRQLKDTIMYQPTFGRYKTYIIDEVHMLSASAFNALLKTLEEPPSHIVFILATTEMQKIPATILSRCQKFEFKKVDFDNIKSRLIQILDLEKIDYDFDAVDYISSISDGAVRDAISMLDQVSSFGKISMKNIDFVTGQSSVKDIDTLIESLLSKNSYTCIQTVEKILKSSSDIKKTPLQLISRLIDYIHVQNEDLKEDIADTEHIKKVLASNKDIDLSDLITKLSFLENDMKYSASPDILFQSFVIKYCRYNNVLEKDDISSLIARIEELENKIKELEKKAIRVSQEKTSAVEKIENINAKAEKKSASKSDITDIKIKEKLSEEEIGKIEFVKSLKADINSVLKEKKLANLTALLFESHIRRYIENRIYISFDREYSFHKTMIEQENNMEAIKNAYSQILKKDIDIFIVFDDEIIEVKDKKDTVLENMKELFGKDINIEVIE